VKNALLTCWLVLIVYLPGFTQTFDDLRQQYIGEVAGHVCYYKQLNYAIGGKVSLDSLPQLEKYRYLVGDIREYFLNKAKGYIKYNYYEPSNINRYLSTREFYIDSLGEYSGCIDSLRDEISQVKVVNKYNSNRQLLEKRYYNVTKSNRDSLNGVVRNKYDKQGRLIEKEELDNGTTLKTRSAYSYNKKNLKKEETVYMVDGWSFPCGSNKQRYLVPDSGFNYKQIHQYDTGNNEIQSITLNDHKCIVDRYCRVFDKEGNKIEECRFNANNDQEYQRVNQFKDGKLMVEERIGAGDRDKTIYKYDEKGNNTELWFYQNSLPVNYSRFVYDDHGNWIKRVVVFDGFVTTIIERVIRYDD